MPRYRAHVGQDVPQFARFEFEAADGEAAIAEAKRIALGQPGPGGVVDDYQFAAPEFDMAEGLRLIAVDRLEADGSARPVCEAGEYLDPIEEEWAKLRLHGAALLDAARWALALIDGGEPMPKPDDDVSAALRAALLACGVNPHAIAGPGARNGGLIREALDAAERLAERVPGCAAPDCLVCAEVGRDLAKLAELRALFPAVRP